MLKPRPIKPDDQDEAHKAYDMLEKFIHDHPEIEPTIWASACWSMLITGYIKSGATYNQFRNECKKVMNHYQDWWEKKGDN